MKGQWNKNSRVSRRRFLGALYNPSQVFYKLGLFFFDQLYPLFDHIPGFEQCKNRLPDLSIGVVSQRLAPPDENEKTLE